MKAKEMQALLRRIARMLEAGKPKDAQALRALADALPSTNVSVRELARSASRRLEVGDQDEVR